MLPKTAAEEGVLFSPPRSSAIMVAAILGDLFFFVVSGNPVSSTCGVECLRSLFHYRNVCPYAHRAKSLYSLISILSNHEGLNTSVT
jgi:hypothetical protein